MRGSTKTGEAIPMEDARTSNATMKTPGSVDAAGTAKPANSGQSIYVEREDDDGYDPWSDRREEPPLFEPDPWK